MMTMAEQLKREGRKEGFKQGIEKGREEGAEEKAVLIAKNMLIYSNNVKISGFLDCFASLAMTDSASLRGRTAAVAIQASSLATGIGDIPLDTITKFTGISVKALKHLKH
jgi:hypothetical protein